MLHGGNEKGQGDFHTPTSARHRLCSAPTRTEQLPRAAPMLPTARPPATPRFQRRSHAASAGGIRQGEERTAAKLFPRPALRRPRPAAVKGCCAGGLSGALKGEREGTAGGTAAVGRAAPR